MTVSFTNVATAKSGGCATGIYPVPATWNRQVQKTGAKRNGGCANGSKPAIIARWRSCERGEQLTFRDWAEWFMENYSKPPIRAPKTHEANTRAMKHLQATY